MHRVNYKRLGVDSGWFRTGWIPKILFRFENNVPVLLSIKGNHLVCPIPIIPVSWDIISFVKTFLTRPIPFCTLNSLLPSLVAIPVDSCPLETYKSVFNQTKKKKKLWFFLESKTEVILVHSYIDHRRAWTIWWLIFGKISDFALNLIFRDNRLRTYRFFF